jgi:HK97 family phage major capsid protein
MLAFGAVRRIAGQILTSSGEPFSWPTADDTSNEGRMIPENTTADDNNGAGSAGDGGPNPSFGKTTWGAYKFTSDTMLVPYELMEDAAVNVAMIIFQMLGERLGRGTNRKFTTGTGAAEPQGIVTGATLGVTAASATAITADEVIDLEHSVDPAYRNGAGYMLHDLTVAHLRKLKATTNQYIWQSNWNAGLPDTLNNRPYEINQHMSNVSSSSNSLYTMLFGQLSAYKVRRVREIRIYRLQERYRNKDQDGFVAFTREDGGILNAGTAPIKSLQQHSLSREHRREQSSS